VPFEEFVVREPAATKAPELEAFNSERQRPAMPQRGPALPKQPYYTAAYPRMAEGGARENKRGEEEGERGSGADRDGEEDKTMRVAQIKRDLSDWRLQKREMDEAYQSPYPDKGVPRMRRH
jgi:hypothetical protein